MISILGLLGFVFIVLPVRGFPIQTAGVSLSSLGGQVDALAAQLIRCRRLPGLTITVVRATPGGGRQVLTRAYGVADVSTNRTVDVNTRFCVAGITQGFTAATLAQLLHENESFSLDSPIQSLLGGWFQLSDPARARKVTSRDILAHRVGLASYFGGVVLGYNLTRTELIRRLRHVPVTSPFRHSFTPNPLLYVLAGHLVQTLNNTFWENVVTKRIFKPLHMTGSTFADRVPNWAANFALPHVLKNGRLVTVSSKVTGNTLRPVGPSSSICSTAPDMAEWMLTLLRNGTSHGDSVLDPSVVDEMSRPHNTHLPSASRLVKGKLPVNVTTNAYNLGWFSGTYRDQKRIFQNGFSNYYGSFITLFPELGLGIFTASNGPSLAAMDNAFRALHYYIADLAMGEKPWINETTACSFPQPWLVAKGYQNQETTTPKTPEGTTTTTKDAMVNPKVIIKKIKVSTTQKVADEAANSAQNDASTTTLHDRILTKVTDTATDSKISQTKVSSPTALFTTIVEDEMDMTTEMTSSTSTQSINPENEVNLIAPATKLTTVAPTEVTSSTSQVTLDDKTTLEELNNSSTTAKSNAAEEPITTETLLDSTTHKQSTTSKKSTTIKSTTQQFPTTSQQSRTTNLSTTIIDLNTTAMTKTSTSSSTIQISNETEKLVTMSENYSSDEVTTIIPGQFTELTNNTENATMPDEETTLKIDGNVTIAELIPATDDAIDVNFTTIEIEMSTSEAQLLTTGSTVTPVPVITDELEDYEDIYLQSTPYEIERISAKAYPTNPIVKPTTLKRKEKVTDSDQSESNPLENTNIYPNNIRTVSEQTVLIDEETEAELTLRTTDWEAFSKKTNKGTATAPQRTSNKILIANRFKTSSTSRPPRITISSLKLPTRRTTTTTTISRSNTLDEAMSLEDEAFGMRLQTRTQGMTSDMDEGESRSKLTTLLESVGLNRFTAPLGDDVRVTTETSTASDKDNAINGNKHFQLPTTPVYRRGQRPMWRRRTRIRSKLTSPMQSAGTSIENNQFTYPMTTKTSLLDDLVLEMVQSSSSAPEDSQIDDFDRFILTNPVSDAVLTRSGTSTTFSADTLRLEELVTFPPLQDPLRLKVATVMATAEEFPVYEMPRNQTDSNIDGLKTSSYPSVSKGFSAKFNSISPFGRPGNNLPMDYSSFFWTSPISVTPTVPIPKPRRVLHPSRRRLSSRRRQMSTETQLSTSEASTLAAVIQDDITDTLRKFDFRIAKHSRRRLSRREVKPVNPFPNHVATYSHHFFGNVVIFFNRTSSTLQMEYGFYGKAHLIPHAQNNTFMLRFFSALWYVSESDDNKRLPRSVFLVHFKGVTSEGLPERFIMPLFDPRMPPVFVRKHADA